ncbi:MAG: SAF domain-containing protein [Acidimicrobiales bacterium]
MPTSSPPTSINGTKKAPAATTMGKPDATLRLGGAGRRRQWPRVGVGIVVVVGCALGFAATSLQIGGRTGVLDLRASLPAGGVITAADLGVVQVSAPGLATLPAAEQASVVGRAAAVPLVAGSLLSPADLGPASTLPAGHAEVAVALKPGGFPPDLTPGDHVLVVTLPATTGAGSAAGTGSAGGIGSTGGTVPLGPTPAVVIGVAPPGANGGTDTVVTLQVRLADAPAMADAGGGGQASLVLVPTSGAGSSGAGS